MSWTRNLRVAILAADCLGALDPAQIFPYQATASHPVESGDLRGLELRSSTDDMTSSPRAEMPKATQSVRFLPRNCLSGVSDMEERRVVTPDVATDVDEDSAAGFFRDKSKKS